MLAALNRNPAARSPRVSGVFAKVSPQALKWTPLNTERLTATHGDRNLCNGRDQECHRNGNLDFQRHERCDGVGGTGQLQSTSLVSRRLCDHLGIRGLGERIYPCRLRGTGPLKPLRRIGSFWSGEVSPRTRSWVEDPKRPVIVCDQLDPMRRRLIEVGNVLVSKVTLASAG